jgi:hypothetical protein
MTLLHFAVLLVLQVHLVACFLPKIFQDARGSVGTAMQAAEAGFSNNSLGAAVFCAALPSAMRHAKGGGALFAVLAAPDVLAARASPVPHTELRGSDALLAAKAGRVLAEALATLSVSGTKMFA